MVHRALVDCVPFRLWFCEQFLAWSCQAGLPPTRFYAGLAGRFVRGFVSNLLRGRARQGCRRRGFTPAWLAVSYVVVSAISCVFLQTGGGPPTWLRRPGVPFRGGFCEQSLAFSSGRGGHQLGYAGLACRSVSGFVINLLRFLPDGGAANLVTPAWRAVSCVVLLAISCVFPQAGGPPTWLRRPGGPFRELLCQQYLAGSCQAGGPANLVTPAWRAVS